MSRLFVGFFVLFIGFWHGGFSQTSIEDGEMFLQKKEYRKAKNALLENKSKERARELLGDLFSYQKNWKEAVDYYKSLSEEYPDNATYHFKYGNSLRMQALEASKLRAAMLLGSIKKSLQKAAELDAAYAQPRRVLVEFYMDLPVIVGGGRESAEGFAAELDDINIIEAQVARAFILEKDEEASQAKAAARKALLEAKRNPALIERNFLRYELGELSARYETNLQTGAKLLNQYIKNHSYLDLKSPARAYYYLAKINVAQNDKKSALEHINEALRLKFNFPEAEAVKGDILEL